MFIFSTAMLYERDWVFKKEDKQVTPRTTFWSTLLTTAAFHNCDRKNIVGTERIIFIPACLIRCGRCMVGKLTPFTTIEFKFTKRIEMEQESTVGKRVFVSN